MLTHTIIPRLEGWFSLGGEDYDVVVATSFHLARNIEDLSFTDTFGPDDAVTLRKRVEQTFLNMPGEYRLLDHDTLRPEAIRFYHSREMLRYVEAGAVSILSPDDTIAVHLGGEDHLTLTSFTGGWNPEEALHRVRVLDHGLEEHLPWAVSLRLGYLSPRVESVGTGLVAEAVLFLPALRQGAGIPAARGLDTDGTATGGKRVGGPLPGLSQDRVEIHQVSSGAFLESSLYRVRCRARFPEGEEDTIALLEETVQRLVHYEREARERLRGEHLLTVSDAVNRARGLLGSALTLTQEEAVAQAALLRLGASCGLIESPGPEGATVLLYAADDDAVALLGDGEGASPDERRARLIGSILRDRV
ncbi:MAG: hypothetical protein EA427_09025 [Spirochaetaceae bacterium]|nr:MAG: hypothetical protein EA427_09025 [Spirochaetaceae bacterium]